MDTRAWKKDRESLTESYGRLLEAEATPVADASELGIHADRPAADDSLELDPLELPDDSIDGEIPHEAQALLDELKAPSFDLDKQIR
jgi:hypothetical protein